MLDPCMVTNTCVARNELCTQATLILHRVRSLTSNLFKLCPTPKRMYLHTHMCCGEIHEANTYLKKII
jgi:hypothetical protein